MGMRSQVSPAGLISAFLALVAAASLARAVSRPPWPLELLNHYPLHYGFLLAAGTLLLLYLREHKRAAFFGVFALWNIGVVSGDLWGKVPVDADAPRLKIVLANVFTENREFEKVEDWILSEDPDLIVLMEVDHRWWARLDRLRERYPHGEQILRGDNFGIALMSRNPFRSVEILPALESYLPSVRAKLDFGGRPLSIFATHPLPPTSQEHLDKRDAQLSRMGALAKKAAAEGEVVLMGDFNTTPWSPTFRRLLTDSGLRDSRRGFGLQATWPEGMPILLLPLDHLLVSPGIGVVERRTGDWNGSDHRPVVASLALR